MQTPHCLMKMFPQWRVVCERTPPTASEPARLPLLFFFFFSFFCSPRSSCVGGGHVDTPVQSHYDQQPSGSPISPVMPLGRHDSHGDTRIISLHANPILQEGKQRPGRGLLADFAACFTFDCVSWQGHPSLCGSRKPFKEHTVDLALNL